MKKTILFIIMFAFAASITKGQDTLAGWVFSGVNPDANVDFYSKENSGLILQTESPQRSINFTKTGANGGDDKCAETKGWENGKDLKYWQIEFMPKGFKNLKISSVQRSCDMHFGPKYFKIQYKVDCCDTQWHDIPGSNITDTSNWKMGIVSNLPIPEECDDEELPIKIRWILTSNLDINNVPITMMGMSRIDNIFITGEPITSDISEIQNTKASIYPNPASTVLNIENNSCKNFEIIDFTGKRVNIYNDFYSRSIDISLLKSGIYYIKFINNDKVITHKFLKL